MLGRPAHIQDLALNQLLSICNSSKNTHYIDIAYIEHYLQAKKGIILNNVLCWLPSWISYWSADRVIMMSQSKIGSNLPKGFREEDLKK